MRGTIRIGRLLGIPIGVDLTWFLLLAWVLSVLALQAYPVVLPREAAWVHWLLALVSGLLFFLCIVLHELGHSVVARYFDIPVRGITLFFLGGVAQITREATRPLPEFLMAVAGPAVSILLGGVFMTLWYFTGQGGNVASVMWEWLWVMNLGLGIFNMLPAFPMDGGRVLRSLIWGVTRNADRATTIAVWAGRALAACFIAAGLFTLLGGELFDVRVPVANGIWMTFIGFFLLQTGAATLRQRRSLAALSRYRVGDVMLRNVPAASDALTVRQALDGPLTGYGAERQWLFLSDGARFTGVVPRAAAMGLSESEAERRGVGELALPANVVAAAAPEETFADLLQRMSEGEARVFPVLEQGAVVGLVHEEQVQRALAAERAAGPGRRPGRKRGSGPR